MRASRGSSCAFDRAFIEPTTGNTTCVWNAPAVTDLETLFQSAGVAIESITLVEEMPAPTG